MLVVTGWVGLWLANAGWLAYREGFELVLVASTVLLVFIFAYSVQRLGKKPVPARLAPARLAPLRSA